MTTGPSGFAAACRELVPGLAEGQLSALLRYGSLVREWNARVNLVSRRDVDRILTYHVIDSLAVSPLVPQGCRVADIGTGAGLPGIPLAVARPDAVVTLVESIRKKCLFLDTVVRELELNKVSIVNGRAESIPPLECAVVLSRLTAAIERVVTEASRHIVPGGSLVFFKTLDSASELGRARRTLLRHRLTPAEPREVVLPLTGITRRFVVLRARPLRD